MCLLCERYCIIWEDAEPAHATVDLKMIGNGPAVNSRFARQNCKRVQAVSCRRQIVMNDCFLFA